MDLIEILRRILKTKNELRDILGETDNISRYPVAIHNALASRYNAGYRVGYRDRYEELTELEDGWVTGPEEILPYDLDDTYYEEFTTEILTDIMKDVLNYKLLMKDELNDYYDTPTVGDEFRLYPEYLASLLEVAYNAGVTDGSIAADDAVEGDEEVDVPTASFSDNKFQMTTEQDDAALWYKVDIDGIDTRYSGPVIISDDCTIYYWAQIGRSKAGSSINCTWSSSGLQAFVYPCTFIQEGNYVKIDCSTNGAVIEYKIDSSEWKSYYAPVLVSSRDQTITARAFYSNEYSKKSVYSISHSTTEVTRPADVQCTMTESSGVVTVTLTCATSGAAIYYSVNESMGYYNLYNGPFTQTGDYFLIYTYSQLNGVESPHRLVYKWDGSYSDNNTVSPVQFVDDSSSLTLYTVTSGASIHYRFGATGEYETVNQNQVTFQLDNAVQVYAYATASGLTQSPITSHWFTPFSGYGGGNGIPKPTMVINGNVVTIYSSLTVRYTIDDSDPRTSGGTVMVYNPQTGIVLETTTTIKAVAVTSDGRFSELAVGVFTPFSDITNGGSGSEWNGGGGEGGGPDTPSEWTNQDWFYVTGASAITIDSGAAPIYISEEGTYQWTINYGPNITLDETKKFYMKGSVNRVVAFSGSDVKIGGDVRSLKTNGTSITTDCNFTGLFRDCAGLKSAADLRCAVISPMANQFKEMFAGCISLTAAPLYMLSALSNVYPSACERMFYGCTGLRNTPAFNFTVIQDKGCYEMFAGCSNIVDASGSRFTLNVAASDGMAYCFSGCHSLVNTPYIECGTTALELFKGCFNGCSSITDVNTTMYLTSKTVAVSCYEEMFKDCTSLISFGSLPATVASDSCYKDMFSGCYSLSDFGGIGLTTLAATCCSGMFRDCSSLTSSPVLNADKLGGSANRNCYKDMFNGCSRLSRIEAHFTTEPLEGWWTDNWVTGVAASGTFVQGPDATWEKYGHYAIPTGWRIEKAANVGIIESINVDASGLVYIKASNADDIYYTYSDSANYDASQCTIPYEGPFQLNKSCYISACCENSDGIRGTVTCVWLKLVLPGLVISCSDNEVTIYTPYDFEYPQIEYQLYAINTRENPETGWTNYSGPFKIEKSQSIAARGRTNAGEVSDIYWADILYGVNAPVIEFTATQFYCTISYPNPDILQSLWYKINDTVVDTSTIETTWTRYTAPFTVRSYIDETHPTVIVTAIAKVTVEGVTGWSSAASVEKSKESSVTLPVPVLRMVDENTSNNVILSIDGVDYPTWDKTATKIAYRFDAKEPKYYTQIFSTAESGLAFSGYVTVYARAESGNVFGDWLKYTLTFNSGLTEFDFESPIISVIEVNDSYYNLSINPPMWIQQDEYGVQHTINTYFRMDVLEHTPDFTSTPYSNWTQWQAAWGSVGGVQIDNRIKKAAIYCYSTDDISTKWADPGNNTNPFIFENAFAIDEFDAPTITFVKQGNQYKIVMTNQFGLRIDTYKFRAENTAWGSGAVNPNKYDDWTTCGNNGELLDAELGYGEFYGYYTYRGIDSHINEVPVVFENQDVVTTLMPPIISVTWDEGKQLNFLKLTNTSNNGVWLQYRITNCEWNGGVVNTHKYDDWKICSLYGESLSEYLMSGVIEARTYLDASHISDVATQNYTNGWIQPLSAPHIYMIDETSTGNHGFRVVNDNKYAQNFFYIENAVWDGYETNPHKYDNAQICYIYENDLDQHLISGTIVYYSTWGGETTDPERLDFVFESNIDTTPPTIVVTKNASSGTYTCTITSNATFMNYPRVKWHMIDMEYDGSPDSATATYYQSWSGDRFKIEQLMSNRMSFSFEIRANVIAGTIEAYSTDETNTMQTAQQGYHETHMTQYFFNINDF